MSFTSVRSARIAAVVKRLRNYHICIYKSITRIASEKFTFSQLVFEITLVRKIETNIKYTLYENSEFFFMAFSFIFRIIDISSSEMQSQHTHTATGSLPTHVVFNPATHWNTKITYHDIITVFYVIYSDYFGSTELKIRVLSIR